MISAVLLSMLAQCSVKAEWLPDYEVLRLEDGTGFGSIERSQCMGKRGPLVRLQFEGDGGATLYAKRSGVELQLQAQRVAPTAEKPIDFGHGFSSGPRTKLDVLGIDGGSALVAPQTRDDVRFLAAWKPQLVPCERLKLGSALTFSTGGTVLPAEAKLSMRPKGEPAFVLAAGTPVNLVEHSHSGSRVTLALADGATIAGWIPLQLNENGGIIGSFRGPAICHGRGSGGRTCTERLPLFVRHEGRLERIGTLDAEMPFEVIASDGTSLMISPEVQFFGLFRGWELVVSAADLERCSQIPQLAR